MVRTKMKVKRNSTRRPVPMQSFTPVRPLVPKPPVLSSMPAGTKIAASRPAPANAPRHWESQ